MTPEISLILPAYNESRVILKTIGEAVDYFESRNMTYEIIVAADGTDGTREIVHSMAVTNPALLATGADARRGKGLGIREAVSRATGKVIGYADADNKVPIEDFDHFRPLLARGVDMVIGSRRKGAVIEKAQPLYRRVGSVGFHFFMQTVVGLAGIQDTQCGFKFFQHDVAKELFRRQKINGYMFDVEILALAERFGYRVREVPIRWRDDADSRLQLLSGNIRNIIDIFKIRSYCRQHALALPRVNAATAED